MDCDVGDDGALMWYLLPFLLTGWYAAAIWPKRLGHKYFN